MANVTFEMKPLAKTECSGGWYGQQPYRRPLIHLRAPGFVPVDRFWSGRTLLWNLEFGPYRLSFVDTGPSVLGQPDVAGWTYRLVYDNIGESLNIPDIKFISPFAPPTACADGFGLGAGFTWCGVTWPSTVSTAEVCIGCDIYVPVDITVRVKQADLIFGTNFPDVSCNPPGVNAVQDEFDVAVSHVFRMFPSPLASPAAFSDRLIKFASEPFQVVAKDCLLDVIAYAGITYSCSLPETIFATVNIYASASGQRCFAPNDLTRSCSSGAVNPADAFATVPILVRNQLRLVCAEWSQEVVEADSQTLTRECGITDGATVTAIVSENYDVPENRSRIPRLLNGSDYGSDTTVLQYGRCGILGLVPVSRSSNQPELVPATWTTSPESGSCILLSIAFGNATNTNLLCQDDFSTFSSAPCDNCVPVVTVLSGADAATVTYRTSGSRAGLIEVVVSEYWGESGGVQFSVACGSDLYTQTILPS
jgi:hypothetical protein